MTQKYIKTNKQLAVDKYKHTKQEAQRDRARTDTSQNSQEITETHNKQE